MDSRKHLAKATLGKKPELQLSQECRQPSPLPSLVVAWGQASAQSSGQQMLQTQDWVCEPPESKRPSRRWSVSIDERRRLAVLGGWERPGVAGGAPSCRDITRIVAQLVSEDVDKDVLLPHPPRSAESTNAFHAFLARSAPFWQNVTLEALGSRSPPS
ncbi:PREDICTED: testis-expressed sequence 22 protein [Ceratotherium simum simum]|uniref:Testis-expressed sequence 22 protein n=1 Tax=Ceratotherium simum simum TaxID=73337 RepID=A0ABM0HUS4_CERSS|nr:PREDICTED: testis-expressed sequence 22 protein [Ceratotherium simum simum]